MRSIGYLGAQGEFSIVLRRAFVLLGLALAGYLAAAAGLNRAPRDAVLEPIGPLAAMPSPPGRALTVMTWNIGYAGLGAESDFVADGGKGLLPPSRTAVEKNLAGIVGVLKARSPDIHLMQETARASRLTHGVDVLGAIAKTLEGRDNAFSADLRARLLPSPFAIDNGLFTSVGWGGARREILPLPLESGHVLGLFKRRYHAQVIRLPIAGDTNEWVVVDIHLSAFDDGAHTRRKQFRAVLDFAEQEYVSGAYVVIGGDWNLELARPGRSYTTTEEDLFWVYPFPYGALKEGWRAAFDAEVPTARTNERPYRAGENFTTVIDGFVVSPNVAIESVATADLDFQFTDHQPATARFSARP